MCTDEWCVEKIGESCLSTLPCGHICHGCRQDEECGVHLPCLYGCADLGGMDKDDMCCLCYTESLSQAPCVQLSCGHIFHVECLRSQLNSRWTGTAINFGFAQCCLCRQDMETPLLQELLAPVRELQEKTNVSVCAL